MTSWFNKVFGSSVANNKYGIDKKEFQQIAKNLNLTKEEQIQLRDGLKNGNMEDVIKNMRNSDTDFYNAMGLELSSRIGTVDVTQNTAHSKLEALRLQQLAADGDADLDRLLNMTQTYSRVTDNLTTNDFQEIHELLSDETTRKYLSDKGCDPDKVRSYITQASMEQAFNSSPFMKSLDEMFA